MTTVSSTMPIRTDDVKMPGLLIYSDFFGKSSRPKLIIRADADTDGLGYYDEEDDDAKNRIAADVKLYNDLVSKAESFINEHELSTELFKVLMPEAGYEQRLYVCTNENLVFEATISDSTAPIFTIYGLNQTTLFDKLASLLSKVKRRKAQKADQVHLISVSGNEFYLTAIDLKKRKLNFSYDNYNEEFEPISKRVIKALRTNNASGLVLFHGDVGTGKTSYMKYLLNQITSKKIIYIPPDMVEHLASPSFVSFLIERAKNSILLIEDAENVLQKRAAGQAQSVSNILNISDGILGDILQMQIVCTFNCNIDKIDEALLRPGRLVASYKFSKLSIDKANTLLSKQYGNRFPPTTKELSLAEVYNYPDLELVNT